MESYCGWNVGDVITHPPYFNESVIEKFYNVFGTVRVQVRHKTWTAYYDATILDGVPR